MGNILKGLKKKQNNENKVKWLTAKEKNAKTGYIRCKGFRKCIHVNLKKQMKLLQYLINFNNEVQINCLFYYMSLRTVKTTKYLSV